MSFTREQIERACQGKSRSAGGLNVEDLMQLAQGNAETAYLSRKQLLALVCANLTGSMPVPAPSVPQQYRQAISGRSRYITATERRRLLNDCNSSDLDDHPCCASKKGDQCSYLMCPPDSGCQPNCDYIYGSTVLASQHRADPAIKRRLERQFEAKRCSRAAQK